VDARLILAAALWVAVPAAAFDHAHAAWGALLQKHVVLLDGGKASRLRYAEMARERPALKAYLDDLARVGEREFAGWNRGEQMAFLINAYNAFAVEKVLTRYPDLGSIWDFGRFFGNPFRDRFFVLLGGAKSLDDLEHGILRKAYREPRVHFAVNCASIGCPMLREEPYVGARLERQLEEQAERFLADRSRNRFREGRLEVSKIFDWFAEDFAPREEYLRRYAALLGVPRDVRPPLVFLDYDWSLNDFPSSSPR
jgi:hypothetical protein